MRVSEILRNLADLVDQTEDAAVQDATGQMPVQAEQPCDQPGEGGAEVTVTHLEPVEIDGTDNSEPETMISPLQQEHELLKKSQGVDNHVEEFADASAQVDAEVGEEANTADQGYNDEIASMKQMAGIGEEQQGPVDHAQDLKPASLNPRANAALQANGKKHLAHTKRRDR